VIDSGVVGGQAGVIDSGVVSDGSVPPTGNDAAAAGDRHFDVGCACDLASRAGGSGGCLALSLLWLLVNRRRRGPRRSARPSAERGR
jgi:hypothetical protein